MPLDKDIPKHLIDLYFHELYYLLREIIAKEKDIRNRISASREKHSLDDPTAPITTADVAIHYDIMAMVLCAANVKKLIRPRTNKSKKESAKIHKLRLYRATLFKKIFEGILIEEMYSNQVRNTIEHYDEYLDESILEITTRNTPGIVTMNIQISTEDTVKPLTYPLKTYIICTHKFHNLDKSIDLAKLKEEAVNMLERVESLIDPKILSKGFSPGGVIMEQRVSPIGLPKFQIPFSDQTL